jgi:hypothetical protein
VKGKVGARSNGRQKDARAAHGIVILLHRRHLDVATQEREMVDVPGEFDALLFDAVGFHRSEGIVGPMLPLMIEVGKILQIGGMPSEARAAEDQAARTVLVRLRGRQALEFERVVEKVGAGGEYVALDRPAHPFLLDDEVDVLRMMLAPV